MWGNLLTEVSYQPNFNITFSNNKSDVLIHLTQWQYWWWFWFAFVWVLYYFIVARIVRHRIIKFRPRIVSSFRPHGKWGDLLICLIPVSWCANILINSNFLLKLIEWQSESSLFTIRIRARQWYWIYKFDLKNITDIISVPKNIGNNKWVLSNFGDLKTSNDYIHTLQLRSQNKWVKKYWSDVVSKFSKAKKFNITSNLEFNNNVSNFYSVPQNTAVSKIIDDSSYKHKELLTLHKIFSKDLDLKKSPNIYLNQDRFNEVTKDALVFTNSGYELHFDYDMLMPYWYTLPFNYKEKSPIGKFDFNFKNNTINYINSFDLKKDFFLNNLNNKKVNILKNKILSLSNQNIILHPEFIENTRWVKRAAGKNIILRLIKLPIIENSSDLLKIRFSENNSKIEHKITPNTTYLTIKQKRYKRRKVIPMITKSYTEDNNTYKFNGNLFLKDNSIIIDHLENATRQYRMMRKNKIRNENIPVVYSKRLLRVKRTLVLPAHVNITAITNSYDIVHSWFIPGLGLKMDCIPGRSTHHTFYIDNVGFYYGQCAEICGRYHHHMPIRICALPFEHFLVWWHSFGINKLIFTNNQKRFETNFAFRKFVW